ncbi:MAG: penicillin-binding transpeptidase domain-containing protein [Dehalococcoidales bacterium]
MYRRRLYFIALFCGLAMAACIVRLAFLQLVLGENYREEMERMRILPAVQLPTVRGSILDRNGQVLAIDRPVFWLHINYRLSCLLDERFRRANILLAVEEGASPKEAEVEFHEEYAADVARLNEIIDKCAEVMACPVGKVTDEIQVINNRIWRRKEFYAWSDNCRDSTLKEQYRYVPQSKAIKEFEELFDDEEERLKLAGKSDRREMYNPQPLFKLDDEQVSQAESKFIGIEEIEILPESTRDYPFASAACQIIGWVGRLHPDDEELFADDKYLRYVDNEVLGKSGVEMVCEVILRGRRGEITYDKSHNVVDHTEAQFGRDVRLSLDIQLQQRIESFLNNPDLNPNADKCIGAVVLDVATGDVLAMVSTPVYDLNTVGQNYKKLAGDSEGQPFLNKALAEHYPPGSTIKPILLVAALEERKLRVRETISCPSQRAPKGWPNCPIFLNPLSRVGHDIRQDEGISNTARNAIRYSCNVFFSHVAHRLDPKVFQRRFFEFGYGHQILPGPFGTQRSRGELEKGKNRFLREAGGYLFSGKPRGRVMEVDDLGPLHKGDLKQFGVGQHNFRATVLQVANAAAVIARGGIYKSPRLFLNDSNSSSGEQVDLGISKNTLDVVRDGMRAGVTERYGTSVEQFKGADLDQRDVKVFGKTGSTEIQVNAWFMGFAEDSVGRAISFAITVEGGQSGSQDAAPLARKIIEFCNEAGYIGRKPD